MSHIINMGPRKPSSPREDGEREARRRFRAARQSLGITQLRASQMLGIGTTTIEDWERGAVRLPAWALVAIEGRAAEGRKAA